ncbi:hypothetical protein [Kytococcus sp. Marseille-QA3725]
MNTAPSNGPARFSSRLLRVATVPVAVLALSACGGGDGGGEEESTGSETSAEESAPAESGEAESDAPAEDSAPAEETPAESGAEAPAEGSAPAESGGDAEEGAPAESGSGESGGDSAALDIATFKDMKGIDKKVDALSAQDACGYWAGAMADPSALDDPKASAAGLKDLAKVAPAEVSDAFTSLSGAMAKAKGPSDPTVSEQLGKVDQACRSNMG